jgi:hypothetical protein
MVCSNSTSPILHPTAHQANTPTPRTCPCPNILFLSLDLHPHRFFRPLNPPLQPLPSRRTSHYKSTRSPSPNTTNPDILRPRLRSPRHQCRSRQRNICLRRRRPQRLPLGCCKSPNNPSILRKQWSFREDQCSDFCGERRWYFDQWEF